MSKKLETEKNLNEALDRILNNTTINIKKGRKLTFSSVEDEAKVGRSLLRSYPIVFERVKTAIFLEKAKKNNGINLRKNRQSNEKKNLRELNLKLKEENIKLKEKNEILLRANIGMADRIYFLEKQISKSN